MPATPPCPHCNGLGLLIIKQQRGYTIYRQCKECGGTGEKPT